MMSGEDEQKDTKKLELYIDEKIFLGFLKDMKLVGRALSRRSAMSAYSMSRDDNRDGYDLHFPGYLEVLARLAEARSSDMLEEAGEDPDCETLAFVVAELFKEVIAKFKALKAP